MIAGVAPSDSCWTYSCGIIAMTIVIVLIFLHRTSQEAGAMRRATDHSVCTAGVRRSFPYDACIVALAVTIVALEVLVAQHC